jgi:hypothetical protein
LKKKIGDDAILKHAYKELNLNRRSKKEIDIYEQRMCKKNATRRRRIMVPPREVSDAESGSSDLIESDILEEPSKPETFPSTEESSDSEERKT